MESEDLRFEIIKMKETRHNNLIQFIGACLDFPNVCVLTEVAPKVSHQNNSVCQIKYYMEIQQNLLLYLLVQ